MLRAKGSKEEEYFGLEAKAVPTNELVSLRSFQLSWTLLALLYAEIAH